MSQFPERIPLPDHIQKSRSMRQKEIIQMCARGVFLRGIIIVAEVVGYVAFGSSTLLLDAVSSLFDVASSLFLIFCIKLAERPPDRNHPFGHGRFEPIGGLQLSILLIGLGIGFVFQQVNEALKPSLNPLHSWLMLIPLMGAILLETSYRLLNRVAIKQHSPALKAEALHYRFDALTSVLAVVALSIVALVPSYRHLVDHLGAASIAIFMIVTGIYACKSNIDQLLDRVPPKTFFSLVREAAEKVSGVKATEKLKIQFYGPDAHVNIDVEVDPGLSVEDSHLIAQKVRASIQEAWPQVRDVMVHIEPYYPGDHFLKE